MLRMSLENATSGASIMLRNCGFAMHDEALVMQRPPDHCRPGVRHAGQMPVVWLILYRQRRQHRVVESGLPQHGSGASLDQAERVCSSSRHTQHDAGSAATRDDMLNVSSKDDREDDPKVPRRDGTATELATV